MISLSASADYGLSGQYIAHITGRHPKYTFDRQFIGRKGGKRNEVSEADVDDPGLYECCDIDKKHGKESHFYLVLEINGNLHKFKSDKEDAMTIAKALDAGRPFNEIVGGYTADPEAVEAKKELDYFKGLVITEGSPDWMGRMERPLTISQKVGQFAAGSTVDQKELQPVVKSEIDRLTKRLEELASNDKYPTGAYEILSKKEAEKKQAATNIQTAVEQCWAIMQALPVKDAKKVLAELKNKVTPPKDKGDTASTEETAEPTA